MKVVYSPGKTGNTGSRIRGDTKGIKKGWTRVVQVRDFQWGLQGARGDSIYAGGRFTGFVQMLSVHGI